VLKWELAMVKARNEDPHLKVKLTEYLSNLSALVNKFHRALTDFHGSRYKTMCHWDLWTSQVMFSHNTDGSPKEVKILDFQSIAPGHPATDIWRIIYSTTDLQFRTEDLMTCLQSYFSIFSQYMGSEAGSFEDFHQEVEERRLVGILGDGTSPVMTLSPRKRPSLVDESRKFIREVKRDLATEDKEEDHPDLLEMRRRIMDLVREAVEADFLKEGRKQRQNTGWTRIV